MLPVENSCELVAALNVRILGQEGAQLTLVLGHGFGCTQSVWEDALPSLLQYPFQGGVRAILFDWPSAGSDTAELTVSSPNIHLYHVFSQILLSLLHQLHVSSCMYVGHSMSAMIGCIAALREPALFRKLILVGASPRYLNTESYYGGFEEEDVKQMYKAMASNFRGWAAGFAPVAVGVDDARAELAVRKFESMLCGMRQETAMVMAKAIFESDFRGVIEEMVVKMREGQAGEMKVVVLQTRKDVAVPLVVSDYLKLRLGNKGRVEVLQADGHLPHLSAPQLFIAALLRNILE